MRSYFQGIRPAGRRTASAQQDQIQSPNDNPVNDDDALYLNNHPMRPEADSLRPTYVSPNPPMLPPIPRVASQYYGSPDPSSPSRPDNKVWGFKHDARTVSTESTPPPSRPPPPMPSELPGISYHQPIEHGDGQHSHNFSRGNYLRPSAQPSKQNELNDPRKSNLRAYTDPFPPRAPPSQERPPPIPTISYQSKDLPPPPPISPTTLQPAQAPPNATNPASSKTRFHRLNPMSLLARRRASQAASQGNSEPYFQPPTKLPASNIPDDYVGIRGSVVHDFSNPRPRRYVSSQDLVSTESRKPGDGPLGRYEQEGRKTGGQELEVLRPIYTSHSDQGVEADKQRTPKFKEHFGNDINPRPLDHDHRRNQSATAILDRRQGGDLPLRYSPTPPQPRAHSEEFIHNPLVVELPASFPADNSLQSIIELDTPTTIKPEPDRKYSPPTSPPSTRSRASSITDPNFQPAGLPKHFKSNASRFSFDLAGVGSSVQEKLLEERHRQKNASRTRSSTVSGASIAEVTEEEDDFDYSNMDFDDGLEERIPGINADDDDEQLEERIPGVNADDSEEEEDEEEEEYYSDSDSDSEDGDGVSNSFDDPLRSFEAMQRMSAAFNSLNLLKPATQERPSSKTGFYKQQNNSFSKHRNQSPTRQESPLKNSSDSSTRPEPSASKATSAPQPPPSSAKPKSKIIEDDLYFDDGMIEDLDLQDGQPFDESVFDDEESRIYGKPLRDLKPVPLVTESKSDDSSEQSTRPISLESGVLAGNRATTADTSRTSVQPPDAATIERKSALFGKESLGPNFNRQPSLTHGNIHAYHDALAHAANRAALEGRFDRNALADEEKPVVEDSAEQRPRVSFSENETEEFPPYPEESSFDNDSYGFGFDDNDMDDDDIVAAANAEALENDDEGFYGSEFGFFAHADESEAQYANGGYFGSPGILGVKRSHSGRANGQEPSLTPITERSEWSQRNSVVSLSTMHQNYSSPLQNANLSQLAAAIQDEEDNMSLSALIKLRRGAWGGGGKSGFEAGPKSPNGSHKASSPGIYGLSPPSTSHSSDHHFPWGLSPSSGLSQPHSHPPQGLNISIAREVSLSPEPEAKPPHPLSSPLQEAPMTTGESETQDRLSPLLPTTSNGSDNVLSPTSGIRRSGAVKTHSRSSSGAESISYVKEKDEDGVSDRWVMEMRRKGEGGTIEVLGRQVVEGGRI